MPTYEYKCDSCLNKFERISTISNRKTPESEPCPLCGELGHIKQTFSVVAGLSYSSATDVIGNQKFQKEVLNPILSKVPAHMRSGNQKFKTTSEF